MGLGHIWKLIAVTSELQKYASYNVLSRKALIWGIPTITLIVFLILMLITATLGIILYGIYNGIIIPFLLSILLFMIRIKCMDDSRAIDGIMWDIKGIFIRIACHSNVISLTSFDIRDKKRKELIYDFYKINTDK